MYNFKLGHNFVSWHWRSLVSSWHNGLSARLQDCSMWVQTPVALLCSLSDKYPYELLYSSSYEFVAERNKIYCLAWELFGPLRFWFIFSSNEDDLSHSTRMTFLSSIKGCANALSVSSSLIPAAEQTNISIRRVHLIFGPLFSLEDHSFIIYSFLLDQLVLEASSWMLNSCSNVHNRFLPFERLTVQGSFSSWH